MSFALAENLQVAWEGIAANKIRSGLTMLGVIIGVATVIALVSIGQGASSQITSRVTSAGSNLLFVTPGMFAAPGGVRGGGGGATTLTMDDAAAIADPASATGALVVAPELSRRSQIIAADENLNVQVRGVTLDYPLAQAVEIAAGRFFEEKDMRGQANVAVIGSQIAEDLFGGFDPLGQQVKVSAAGPENRLVPLTVVGVMAAQGSSTILGDNDNAVLAPLTTVQNRIAGGRNARGDLVVSRITAVAPEGASASVADEIDALLRRRHKLADDADADFSVVTQEDLLDVASSISGTLTLFLGFIAAISLVVGGIGIMNIMLVSVTERTREIGIRKAVGARRSDILTQFLLEAVVLSTLGGIAGIVLGAGIAWAVNYSGLLTTTVSPAAVVVAASFALLVGLISGVYPASRAAGLRPVEALRYE